MRSFIILFAVVFGLSIGGLYLWKNQSGTEYLMNRYQKIAPFSKAEMTYHSASSTITGNGIVFYKPQFPNLPLRFKVDRLQMEATPFEVRLHFSNIAIDMAQTLISRDGMDLAETLKSFIPPQSFITQPLETFVLLNHDVFKGSADLLIRFEGKQTRLIVTLYQKGKEILRFVTIIQNTPEKGLWHWVTGSFQAAQFIITDPDWKRAILDYYRGSNRPVPPDLQRAVDTGTPFKALIRLNAPMPVLGLLKRF